MNAEHTIRFLAEVLTRAGHEVHLAYAQPVALDPASREVVFIHSDSTESRFALAEIAGLTLWDLECSGGDDDGDDGEPMPMIPRLAA